MAHLLPAVKGAQGRGAPAAARPAKERSPRLGNEQAASLAGSPRGPLLVALPTQRDVVRLPGARPRPTSPSSRDEMERFVRDCRRKCRRGRRALGGEARSPGLVGSSAEESSGSGSGEDEDEGEGEGEDEGEDESAVASATERIQQHLSTAWQGFAERSQDSIEREVKKVRELLKMHPSPALRLQGLAYVINAALFDRTSALVHKGDCFELLLSVARSGEIPAQEVKVSVNPATFAWPRAHMRRAALLCVVRELERQPEGFLRRSLVKAGAIVCLATCVVKRLSADVRSLTDTYAAIEAGTRKVASAALALVTSEEIERSLPQCRALPDEEGCLVLELERRTRPLSQAQLHSANVQACRRVQQLSHVPLEERLLAARLEGFEQALLQDQKNVRAKSRRQAPLSDQELSLDRVLGVASPGATHVVLQEGAAPNEEQKAALEASLGTSILGRNAADAEETEVAAMRKTLVARRRQEQEQTDAAVQQAVLAVLGALVTGVEAREYAPAVLQEALLEASLPLAIDDSEARREVRAQRERESASMRIEDARAEAVRAAARAELEANRRGMLDEDKEGIRKALKKLSKGERREYMLREEAAERKYRRKEAEGKVDACLAECEAMQAEDRLARRVRKWERQQQQPVEAQPQHHDHQLCDDHDEWAGWHAGEDDETAYAQGWDQDAQWGEEGHWQDAESAWQTYQDEHGYDYFYNAVTGVSQYESPFT